MTSFSWLQLTDFHQGMREQDRLWDNVKEQFFKDLKRLYKKSNTPWDMVLFTGDLTQKGKPEEFEQINSFIEELWGFFKTELHFPKEPVLLAVPGNHDLTRPDSNDHSVRQLRESFLSATSIQEEFWENDKCRYRQVVNEAFQNYLSWWDNQHYRPQDNFQKGIIPGDFSYTFRKGDSSFGIVGLNSSFLQLTNDNYEKKLFIDSLQFKNACNDNGANWINQHNASLFITHHPPTWLSNNSRRNLQENIIGDYFAAHLCGHLHEAAFQDIAEGGGDFQRTWQGLSPFGLEYFGDETNKRQSRSHGYTAGTIQIINQEKGKLFFYPRQLRLQGRTRNIVPDYSFQLTDCQHTIPREFSLKKRYEGSIPEESVSQDMNQNFNLEEYKNIVRSIVSQQKKINGYKLVHEALQFSSYSLSQIQNDVAFYVAKSASKMIYKNMTDKWKIFAEELEVFMILDFLEESVKKGDINADFKAIIEYEYAEFFVKIPTALQLTENIMMNWKQPEDVEKEINKLTRKMCELQTIICDFLTGVDGNLKQSIEEFKGSLEQLGKSIDL